MSDTPPVRRPEPALLSTWPSSATACSPRLSIAPRGSCGRAFPASMAIPCSAACWRAPTIRITAATSRSRIVDAGMRQRAGVRGQHGDPRLRDRRLPRQRRRDRRFRAALPALGPHLPAAAAGAPHPSAARPPARAHPRAPASSNGAPVRRTRRAAVNHLRYVGPQTTLRLTTDAPISYVGEGTPFALDRPLSFFFGTDEPLRTEVDGDGAGIPREDGGLLA